MTIPVNRPESKHSYPSDTLNKASEKTLLRKTLDTIENVRPKKARPTFLDLNHENVTYKKIPYDNPIISSSNHEHELALICVLHGITHPMDRTENHTEPQKKEFLPEQKEFDPNDTVIELLPENLDKKDQGGCIESCKVTAKYLWFCLGQILCDSKKQAPI